jgi:ABC-type oligopeptide transport system substrate-binding subunit
MNKKILLPLALLATAALFSGCAHQTTRTGSKTVYLGGVVEIERGAYQAAPINSIDASTHDMLGNIAKPSGTQTKILWGLITTNDY